MIAASIDGLLRSISSLAFVRNNRFDGTRPFLDCPGVRFCPIHFGLFLGRSTDFDDRSYGDAKIAIARAERHAANFLGRSPKFRLFVEEKLKDAIRRTLDQAGGNDADIACSRSQSLKDLAELDRRHG